MRLIAVMGVIGLWGGCGSLTRLPAATPSGRASGADTDPGQQPTLPPAIAIHMVESTDADRAQTPLPAMDSLEVRFVRPKDTDVRMTIYLQDHYVMLSRSVPWNGKALVFFPGTFAMPRNYQWLLAEATSLGYRAIGLEYPNANDTLDDSSVTQVCAADPNVRCSFLVRQSRLRGDHSWPSIHVDEPDSILNRLAQLIDFLVKNFPDEGWEALGGGGQITWENLALAGHSQGAGFAALLAKEHPVARVALFSGAGDHSFGTLAPWLFEQSATALADYYALAHVDEPDFSLWFRGYAALGVPASRYRFDAFVLTDPVPAQIHEFALALPPNDVPGAVFGAAHGSVATDRATPLTADGRPAYLPVWDAMLATR
jgi:pimeloyl-ACP methyl ester carboxylesterase